MAIPLEPGLASAGPIGVETALPSHQTGRVAGRRPDPAFMASKLAEIEEARRQDRAAGVPEAAARELTEIELRTARLVANDSPKGHAAQREAASLEKELAALEPQRPYHLLDLKPRLERMGETGEAAERSVQAELVTPRE